MTYWLDHRCFSGDLVQSGIMTAQRCANEIAWMPGYLLISEDLTSVFDAITDEGFAKNFCPGTPG